MNKKNYIFLIWLIFQSSLFSHSLLLNVFDNEDDTITVEALFSTGEPALGAQIRLESIIDGKVIYKERFSNKSELTIGIPKQPYNIILDGGPSHKVIKEGIPPLKGFFKEDLKSVANSKRTKETSANSISKMNIILISILSSLFLLFLTIFICARNTNRLIIEVRKINKDN